MTTYGSWLRLAEDLRVSQNWDGHLWTCPRCDFKVHSTREPKPCEDHPFDRMVRA